MDSLKQKIDLVKDDYAAEGLKKLQNYHEQQSLEESLFVLGRIKQNDHLGVAISNNLSTQTILALQRFQQEKKHESLGFETFDQFLDRSPYSPMTKHQYYERLAIVNKLGTDVADLLTSIGISMRSQKLLTSGDVSIKDDQLLVGGKAVEIADTGIIKEVLGELFDERRQNQIKLDAQEQKIEKQKKQIDRGQEEYEELRRNFDALDETPRFPRSVIHVTNAFFNLIEAVGELDDNEKKSRATDDLKMIAGLYFRLSDAYGVKQALAAPRGYDAGLKPIDEMTEEEKKATFFDRHPNVLADDDDFGDENE